MLNSPTRPRWEVADVLRRFGISGAGGQPHFAENARVIRNIVKCRTAALGGHLERCGDCDFQRPVYNSCRDRHCPKCQTMTKERWLDARKSELLPVEYFHKVFTLPHELNALTLANKRVILNLLFMAVSETLLSFGADKRSRLQAKVGFTLILHTWNQKLMDHFHLHCVIPAGGLSSDGNQWIRSPNPGFLFSVKALGLVFRGKFLGALLAASEQGRLRFPGGLRDLESRGGFNSMIETLRSKEWVVYSKAPFGGPEKVLEYLGRYTHRIAISNNRIQDIDSEGVSFTFRDRANGNIKKVEKIAGSEFARRFLLHTLPLGFVRIRHFGFLASRCKSKLLSKCREALNMEPYERPAKITSEALLLERCGIDILKCPQCAAGRMAKVDTIFDERMMLRRAAVIFNPNSS